MLPLPAAHQEASEVDVLPAALNFHSLVLQAQVVV